MRLEEAVKIYQQDTSQSVIRDGLVQRFEFIYEITHKLLRRYLAAPRPPERISSMNFADVIRMPKKRAFAEHLASVERVPRHAGEDQA